MKSVFDRGRGSVQRGSDLGDRCTGGLHLGEALLIRTVPGSLRPIQERDVCIIGRSLSQNMSPADDRFPRPTKRRGDPKI
jgi:hypothetical protein